MNPTEILLQYYNPGDDLFAILLIHSRMVAAKALNIARRKGLDVDLDFVYEAAMLHDIGIIHTDAPGIHCHGSEPYIRHGVMGADMLRHLGLYRHALVCERHTGAGITRQQIKDNSLPLDQKDYLPISTEEKLICYADKYYSKSGSLIHEKPYERILKSMEKFGSENVTRFLQLHEMFS